MNIHDLIKNIIQETYTIVLETNRVSLFNNPQIKHTKHLTQLISLINNESNQHKVIAQKLEEVIVEIKLQREEERSLQEKKFLAEVERLIYAPQNAQQSELTHEVLVSNFAIN